MNRSLISIKTGRLLAGLLFCCILFVSSAGAATDVKEGYDENTELTIKGKVSEVLRGARGPVILKLLSQGRTFEVITAPPWYLQQEGIHFDRGMDLTVTGSKYFGSDGGIYIICSRLLFGDIGREVRLRDADFRPLWSGDRRGMGPGRQVPAQ